MHLTHHDDGKQRWQSHEVGLFEKDFYNQDYDIFSHNFMDLTGYGETKEQAVEDFKRKFRYLLDEWNAFAKLLLDSDVVENEMIEVDCFGEPIDKKGENEMSLNVRYLSNGKRALYCVSNTGVTPSSYTTYESINDIPESIRHYAPKGEPKVVDPDTAQLLGFGPDLFPEFEHRCMYHSDLAVACIGPGCQVVGEGSPIYCPYWVKEKNYENHG